METIHMTFKQKIYESLKRRIITSGLHVFNVHSDSGQLCNQ